MELNNRLASYLYILVLYEHRKTCEMVCLTNCSCRARFSCYLFNAIIRPEAVIYQKEKMCYRTLQSASRASFKTVTKQPIEMVRIC